MATGIYASDINSWYARVNAILSKHNLTTIDSPTIQAGSTPVRASQTNELISELSSWTSDRYFSQAPNLSVPDISSGAVMQLSDKSAIEGTITSVEANIVCRNDATNSYGTNSNGINTNGNKENGYNANGTCSNGSNSNGDKYNGTCSNGRNDYGSNSYGTCRV